MHEQTKIDEAGYFLGEMERTVADRRAFNFNLSAFLSAARSAVQYALKEAQGKAGGQAWYDGAVASRQILAFFKGKRNLSIHEEPVTPSATIGVHACNTIRLSDSVTVSVVRADGTVEPPSSSDTPPSPMPPSPPAPARVTHEYRFQDWTGSEDVLALSAAYLADVKALVVNGRSKGFVTP